MAQDIFETVFSEEAQRMDAFSEEMRGRLRDLMRDLEQEFQQFLERMLADQMQRFESDVQAMLGAVDTPVLTQSLGSALEPSAPAEDGGFMIGNAFNSALNAALNHIIRTGNLKPRAIANAGARGLVGAVMYPPAAPTPNPTPPPSSRPQPDAMRLSRAQKGDKAMQSLAHAERNR